MTTLPDTSLKAWRPPMGWNSWDSYGTTITEDECSPTRDSWRNI